MVTFRENQWYVSARITGTFRGEYADGSGGIQRRHPERPMSSMFLERHTRTACRELIEEQGRADLLRAHGVEPRHRILLVGPPGNGKTSLAESLAYELALPLFAVRYDAVVTSYLGETAQRLRRLFDYVRSEPCVLFFDEFDAIGKERGDLHETGEINRSRSGVRQLEFSYWKSHELASSGISSPGTGGMSGARSR